MNTRNVYLLLFMALRALPLHGDPRTHLESTPGAPSKPASFNAGFIFYRCNCRLKGVINGWSTGAR